MIRQFKFLVCIFYICSSNIHCSLERCSKHICSVSRLCQSGGLFPQGYPLLSMETSLTFLFSLNFL